MHEEIPLLEGRQQLLPQERKGGQTRQTQRPGKDEGGSGPADDPAEDGAVVMLQEARQRRWPLAHIHVAQ